MCWRSAISSTKATRRREKEAAVSSAELERELTVYESFANTERRRQMAASFATRWNAVKGLGQTLIETRDKKEPPRLEDLTKLRALRVDLERFLQTEMRQEALDAFNARKETTFRNLRDIVGLAAVLLLAGGLIAVVTSAMVGRGVVRGERAIAEQGERLRTTLASIGDAVLTTDTEGRITSLNPVAESLTGWSSAEAMGQPLETVFRIENEETRQTVKSPATRALREGTVVGLANHTVLIARDGTEHFIDDSAAPVRSASGQIVGTVLVFRDISERKHADVTAARLAAIVESSDDAIVGKNLEGIVTSWNTGAERVFGYTASEMVGQSILRHYPPGAPRRGNAHPRAGAARGSGGPFRDGSRPERRSRGPHLGDGLSDQRRRGENCRSLKGGARHHGRAADGGSAARERGATAAGHQCRRTRNTGCGGPKRMKSFGKTSGPTTSWAFRGRREPSMRPGLPKKSFTRRIVRPLNGPSR